jgi:hypothetical protein
MGDDKNYGARPLLEKPAAKSHADSLAFTACNLLDIVHEILQVMSIAAACINNGCE